MKRTIKAEGEASPLIVICLVSKTVSLSGLVIIIGALTLSGRLTTGGGVEGAGGGVGITMAS